MFTGVDSGILIKVFSNWLSMSTKKIRMDTVTSPRWRSWRCLAMPSLYPVVARLLGGLWAGLG